MATVPDHTDDSTFDGQTPTVKHYRVKVPTEQFIRMHEAREGMVLARDVYHENGQLLYPAGTTLDASTLRRLRNFNRRSLYVRDEEIKWVEEETFRDLSDDAECLEEKEIAAPEPQEPDDGSDPAGFRRAFEFLSQTDSTRRLQSFVGELRENAKFRDQDYVPDELDSVFGQVGELEELFKSLLVQLNQVSDESTRNEILDLLVGASEPDVDPRKRDDIPDEIGVALERWLDEKSNVRLELMDLLHEDPWIIEGLDPSAIPETGSVGLDRASDKTDETDRAQFESPGDPAEWDFDVSNLLDQDENEISEEHLMAALLGLLRESELEIEGLQSRLGELENQLDDFLRKRGTLDDPEVDGVNDLISGDILSSLGSDNESPGENLELEPGDRGEPEPVFRMFGTLLETLLERTASRDSDQDAAPGAHDVDLGDWIGPEFTGHFDDRDLDVDLNQSKNHGEDQPGTVTGFDQSADYTGVNSDERTDREEIVFEFLDELREFLPRVLESLDESTQSMVREVFRSVSDELFLDRLTETGEGELAEKDLASDESDNKRRDILDQAVTERDVATIKKLNGLPNTVIDQLEELYERPVGLNKWQNKLLDRYRSILFDLVYGLKIPRDEFDRYLHQAGQILDKERKPFSLLVEPPDPRHYHLAHAFNTSLMALVIARELDVQETQQETLVLAGALADIGLTLIPDSFYLKQEDLSPRAKNEILKHPLYSRKIAGHILGPEHPVTQLVGEHHERLDASGYPQGKQQSELSFLTGILTVADTYTAMTENRVYRSRRLPDDALSILDENSGAYPEEALGALKRTIGYYPNGSVVKLTDGRVAFVHRQNEDAPREPDVLILTDEKRNRLDHSERCDLYEEENLSVMNLLRTKGTDHG